MAIFKGKIKQLGLLFGQHLNNIGLLLLTPGHTVSTVFEPRIDSNSVIKVKKTSWRLLRRDGFCQSASSLASSIFGQCYWSVKLICREENLMPNLFTTKHKQQKNTFSPWPKISSSGFFQKRAIPGLFFIILYLTVNKYCLLKITDVWIGTQELVIGSDNPTNCAMINLHACFYGPLLASFPIFLFLTGFSQKMFW